MSYSAYLEEHIQKELTKAVAEATIQRPKDVVDYIGNYLLKIVKDDARAKETKEINAKWAEEDKELEIKMKEKQLMMQKRKEEEEADKLKDEEFYAQLEQCKSKTEAMQSWSEYIGGKTKSVSVYIGEPCQLKQEDEDVNGLLYNAVSSKENEFLLNTTFIQSETRGIVFDLLKAEENAEDEEEENEDDENTEKKEEAPKPRKNIHIENVLLPNPYKDKLHFFTYPKVGSFLSFESTIKSYLNTEAIQAELRPQWPRPIEEIIAEEKAKAEAEKAAKEAATKEAAEKAAQEAQANGDNEEAAKEETDAAEEPKEAEEEEDPANNEEEEEEEEKELPPDPPQIAKKYVVCMDTLGDAQLYDKKTVQWIDDNIGRLEQILMKIDVGQYLKQREFEENMKVKLAEYEEKTKGEIDAKLAEIEAENEESNAEQIKGFKKSQYVIQATQSIWSMIADHVMKPQQSTFCKIIAAFVKLFDNEEPKKVTLINKELSQLDVISDRAWNECINCLKDVTSEKVDGYNPNEIETFDVSLFDKLLNGINGEDIGNEGLGIIITMLYQFVDASCKLYKFTEEEKKKAETQEKQANEEDAADAENE